MNRTRTGLEVLLGEKRWLIAGKRVGLVTNTAGVDGDGRPNFEILAGADDAELVRIFSPEHGLFAREADGAPVDSTVYGPKRIPVVSLYGEKTRPGPADLEGLDLLLFDLQDVGVRFYTYIYTLGEVLRACAGSALPLLVLDRPNPIGDRVTGPVLDPAFRSIVGPYEIPMRFGMTIGELARHVNRTLSIGADLAVIPLQNYRRASWFDETGLRWVPPSPAMVSAETAVCYPGTCLIEGTNLSEGRGTDAPFLQFGAPWMAPELVRANLAFADHAGADLADVEFTPAEAKHAGTKCQGLKIDVRDRAVFEPVATVRAILQAVVRIHEDAFQWRRDPGAAHPFVDLLYGGPLFRLSVEAGLPETEIEHRENPAVQAFLESRKPDLLYE